MQSRIWLMANVMKGRVGWNLSIVLAMKRSKTLLHFSTMGIYIIDRLKIYPKDQNCLYGMVNSMLVI